MADVGRVASPPHSIEAEQALLGGLLIDPTAWVRVTSLVTAADFYRADHRRIFAAMAALQAAQQPIDAVTVSDYLERHKSLTEAGGLSYIARMAVDTPGAANVEAYAQVVRDRSSLRQLKTIGDQIVKASTENTGQTAAELVAAAQDQLQRLLSRARTGTGLVPARQLIGDLLDDLDRRSSGPTGLNVGLTDFDELTCGLEAGDLVVIAARPGMGKTALLVSIASRVSENLGTAVFSAEMPSQQLMRRAVALQTPIPQGQLRNSEKITNNQWAEISNAAEHIARSKLWIDDTAAPTLRHIRAETLALKAREGLDLLLIDYMQLLKGDGKNRYEEIRDVSYGIKGLAKELGIPIIVLAQLNRDVERRDQKRPSISDLRDSGAIEEAADIVGLLYSESYYDDTFPMPYVLECHIAKHRNGERGECLWHFDGALSRVVPLDPGAAAQYRRLLSKRQRRDSDL